MEAQMTKVKKRKTSQIYEVWHRLKKNKMAMAGLYVLIFILLASLIGPFLLPYSYDVQNYDVRSQFRFLYKGIIINHNKNRANLH